MTRQEKKKLSEERKAALIRVSGLSEPSKMPCYGYSTPASACKLGSILQAVKGSVCYGCYAMKGMYIFKNVRECLARRLQAVLHLETWVDDMTLVISWKEKSGYFRWHDSGDLQSVKHLEQIAQVARNTPSIRHWLPTRETSIVKEWLSQGHTIPENLTIRLSATKIDAEAPKMANLPTSGVSATNFNCPASKQNNECRDCRKCWFKENAHIVYKQH